MFITAITFIVILGVLILAHELGHFVTARLFKVKAEEFGLGLPPRIFGYVKDEQGKWKFIRGKDDAANYRKTVWSFNWLPLGGFVAIKGENGENKSDPDSFGSKKIWQRVIIMSAGVGMNFVLAFVLLSIAFMVGIPSLVDDQPDPGLNAQDAKIQIISIVKDSPAQAQGLKIGDVILNINNNPISAIEQVQNEISANQDNQINITISRAGEEITRRIIPVSSSSGQPARVGIGLVKTAMVKYPWYQSIYKGAEATVTLTVAILKAFAKIIGELGTGQKISAEVSGPVGIAALTGQVVKLGFIYVLQFAALLSINLAIINLLPIPALDGGRLLFLAIEKIKGSPVRQSIEAGIHQIGFIFLMIFMALIILRDIKIYLF